MANLIFYIVSIGAVAAAVGVIVAKNPIISVLSLLASFFCLATIYLLAGFQFMAAAQLLVYAGAIMVLFLFVIMLLNLGDPEVLKGLRSKALGSRRLALPMGIAGGLLLVGMVAIGQSEVRAAELAGNSPAIDQIGAAAVVAAEPTAAGGSDAVEDLSVLATLIFSKYMLPFEAAGILLLAATVAVLVLAKRERSPALQEGQTST